MKKIIFLATFFYLFLFTFPQKALALSISNISQDKTSVNLYEKIEVSFNVAGSVATNLQFPYDTQEIPGLSNRKGITVDGLFLPTGETDWNNALVQPGFLFQPTEKDRSLGGSVSEWVYPRGEPYWVLRFSPKKTGDWHYKIRIQDNSGSAESGERTFSVRSAQVNKHGFIGISPNDSRYFEFSDGKPFIGVGHQVGLQIEKLAEQDFELYSVHKVNYFRSWMSSSIIFSRGTHEWDAWQKADDHRSTEAVYQDRDFSIKLSGSGDFLNQKSGGSQNISGGFEAGKSYKVQLRVKLVNLQPENLAVKLLSDPHDFNSQLKRLAPQGSWRLVETEGDWRLYESNFTNDRGRMIFAWESALAFGLENAGSGTAYIDELYIGEDLGGGQIGPNVVFKGKMNYHQYFDPIASAHWDEIIKSAAEHNLSLQLVILDKDDNIFGRIDRNTGIFNPSIPHSDSQTRWNNFYAGPNTKVRRLHEYFWRYLVARWGYCTAIHSWELLNEGDPNNGRHQEQTNALCKFMKENNPTGQLAGTSNWSAFPPSFWNNPNYPNITHTDLHGYNNSSGSYHFNVPELDDPQLARDMALFHINYSQWAFEQGAGKPIIRGEAGIYGDGQSWNESETSDLANDQYGVWLHNYLWSGLDPWGLYELYWWTGNIKNRPGPDGNTSNGLYEVYTPFVDFMDNIPLTNGHYQNAAPQTSVSNIRAWGQKDNKGGGAASHAHLWIQNKNHTWKNVVQGGGGGNLSGTVTVSGFSANTSYPVEWWQFNNNIQLTKSPGSVTSNGQGQIVLSLPSNAVDAGVKIGDYGVDLVCQYDYDDNGLIGVGDLLYILRNWGNQTLGITELLQILRNWGVSCD